MSTDQSNQPSPARLPQGPHAKMPGNGLPQAPGRVRYPQLADAAWLEREYVQLRRTTYAIAAELGCDRTIVGDALKRNGIVARHGGTARSIFVGQRYGRLVVKGVGPRAGSGKSRHYACLCVCGEIVEVRGSHLRSDHTTSCGCLHREVVTTHGHTAGGGRSPTYQSWSSMVARATNPGNKNWADYGGRGIQVCDAWRYSFETFLADLGERPEGTSIDRINVDGDYEPSNCRWATAPEQRANRRPRRAATGSGT